MSKKIDYDKIIRESFFKAQRELGLVKEQDEKESSSTSVFIKEFNENTDMPEIKIRPTEWGLKTSAEAQQINAIIEGILAGSSADQKSKATDPLSRYKLLLTLLNETLETEASAYAGLKPAEQKSIKNARTIVTSLQTKSLMAAILRQSPQVAGKIYEGLISRMVGGYTNNPSDEPIQDFFDGDNHPISLKVIRAGGDVEGSKLNLAKGISKYDAITYLVNVKNSDNPFSLEVFSFTINKNNFFYFIYGVNKAEKLATELITRIEADIATMTKSAGKKTVKESINEVEAADSGEDKKKKESTAITHEDIINAYFDAEGKKDLSQDQKIKLFKQTLKNIVNSITIEAAEAAKYYDRVGEVSMFLLPTTVKNNWKGKFENLGDLFFSDSVATPFKMVTWNSINTVLTILLEENNPLFLAAVFSDDPNLRQKAKFFYEKEKKEEPIGRDEELELNKVRSAASNERSNFLAIRETIGEKFRPFRNFVEKMQQAKQDAEKAEIEDASISTTPAPQGRFLSDRGLDAKITDFWDKIKEISLQENKIMQEEKESGKTSFKLPISTVKSFAIQNKSETKYDDTYPKVIVGETQILKSGQENAKLFKDTIMPFYKALHYITQGINAYFIEDKLEGLTVVNEKGIEPLTSAVQSTAGKKASQLEENKDNLNNMTKEARMVMEMIQRMED